MKCPNCNWEGPPEEYLKHYDTKHAAPKTEKEETTESLASLIERNREKDKEPKLPQEFTFKGVDEWNGIKAFSALLKDGEETWTVKLQDMAGNVITVEEISSLTFEEFPEEPIPLITNLSISRSTQQAILTGFPTIYGNAVIISANFKGTVRVRKEIMSLFFFYETLT
jgi:hypothetical protein